jgi:hypothetical protein
MDPNMTPTSNRSWRADTPQQEQQSPFQGTGYIPELVDPNSPFQPSSFHQPIPFGGHIPWGLTYDGMVAHGMRPTNFGNFPRYPNQIPTEVEEIVPETQQSPPTPEINLTIDSNPTPESNPTSESNRKGKGKNPFENRKEKQPWSRVEEEALMKAFINISEDPIVGNAQFLETSRGLVLQHYGDHAV